jgi:RNA polymerase sigma factor (sigma-70 family)
MSRDKYSTRNNQELIQDCLQEQAVEAWQEFVRRFQPLVSNVVAQVARRFGEHSSEVITDLTQEVYLRLCTNEYELLKQHRGQHDNSLFGYLKVISASVAHDHFKSRLRAKRGGGVNVGSLEEALLASATQSLTVENELLVQEIRRALNRIVSGKTAERDQLIFWLHFRQGFTSAEIAAIPGLGLGEKGVSSLLQRLISNLRQELVKGGPRERRMLALSGE